MSEPEYITDSRGVKWQVVDKGAAQCPNCTAYRERCAKCGDILSALYHTLHAPFGSLNSNDVPMICDRCYKDYARLGFEWLGRTFSEESWK